MKLSNCRVVRSSTQPAENQRIYSQSSLTSHTMYRNLRSSVQMPRGPDQNRNSRRAPRQPCRKSRPGARMFRKLQKRLQQHRSPRRNSRVSIRLRHPRHRQRIRCASTRTIYAPDQNRNGRRAPRQPYRKSRPGAPMFKKPQKRLQQHHPPRRNSRDRSIPK